MGASQSGAQTQSIVKNLSEGLEKFNRAMTDVNELMRVVGRSDDKGAYPAERPTSPADVVANIYRSLGVDLHTDLPGPQGRPFPVVDTNAKPLTELF